MTPGERNAYHRGYNAGSKGAWPDHKPPIPPHRIVGEMYSAARKLRDAGDDICSVLLDDDVVCVTLNPSIDAMDKASKKLSKWLRESNPDTSQPENVSTTPTDGVTGHV